MLDSTVQEELNGFTCFILETVAMTARHGEQTACVLMLADKLAGDPRKLTLSFLPLKASVIQGPNLCLGDDKDW
jgi:hypothetical protein